MVRLWRSLLRYPPGRLDGWSANPNIFADTLLPLVGIAGGVALFFRGIRRWAALVLCFIGLGFLVLTGSRAAIVGLIVSALLLFYLRVLRRYMASASARQKTVAAVTAVVLGAGLFYGLFLLRPGSVMGRLLIYRITAASLVQHPSGQRIGQLRTGIYPTRPPISNGIRIALSAFTPPTRTLVSTNYYRRATNSSWAGIALFILTLWYLFTLKTPGSRGLLILKVSLAGMLVASMFSYPLRSLPSAGEYAVFFALFISYDRNRLLPYRAGKHSASWPPFRPSACLYGDVSTWDGGITPTGSSMPSAPAPSPTTRTSSTPTAPAIPYCETKDCSSAPTRRISLSWANAGTATTSTNRPSCSISTTGCSWLWEKTTNATKIMPWPKNITCGPTTPSPAGSARFTN